MVLKKLAKKGGYVPLTAQAFLHQLQHIIYIYIYMCVHVY